MVRNEGDDSSRTHPQATNDNDLAITTDFFYRSVERFADWVKFQDAKAGGVAAFVTIVSADLMNHIKEVHQPNQGITLSAMLLALAFVAAAITAWRVAVVWWPIRKAEHKSFYFWRDVADMTYDEYQHTVEDAGTIGVDAAISRQAWQLAKIVAMKTRRVQFALGAATALAILWLVARASLAWSG